MKSFLIIGEPADLHAHYVSWALSEAGYKARLINATHENCPTTSTLYLDEGTDEFSGADWAGAEAAWCRRLPRPPIADTSEGEDEAFVLVEERRFARWFIDLNAAAVTRWINPPAASITAENKFIQLKLARTYGLKIPRTLVTAQPDRFRAFVAAEALVIAKPLCPYSWEYADGVTYTTFANVIDAPTAADLSDDAISRCVTMYQQRIAKIADIRVVIIGEDVLAYEIRQKGEQHLDFRIGFFAKDHLVYAPITLPVSLREKITAFTRAMGVNFASADFALTETGEFVFLDLNPNGQWLFLETECPEVRLGPSFCSFFVHGKVEQDAARLFPSFAEYNQSDAAQAMEEAFRLHANKAGANKIWKEKLA